MYLHGNRLKTIRSDDLGTDFYIFNLNQYWPRYFCRISFLKKGVRNVDLHVISVCVCLLGLF